MRGLWTRPRVVRHAVDAISGTFGRVRERFWPTMRLVLIVYAGVCDHRCADSPTYSLRDRLLLIPNERSYVKLSATPARAPAS